MKASDSAVLLAGNGENERSDGGFRKHTSRLAPGRTVGPNYCGSSEKNLALRHLSGAYNFEVAHTFLGNLWAPGWSMSLVAWTTPTAIQDAATDMSTVSGKTQTTRR